MLVVTLCERRMLFHALIMYFYQIMAEFFSMKYSDFFYKKNNNIIELNWRVLDTTIHKKLYICYAHNLP